MTEISKKNISNTKYRKYKLLKKINEFRNIDYEREEIWPADSYLFVVLQPLPINTIRRELRKIETGWSKESTSDYLPKSQTPSAFKAIPRSLYLLLSSAKPNQILSTRKCLLSCIRALTLLLVNIIIQVKLKESPKNITFLKITHKITPQSLEKHRNLNLPISTLIIYEIRSRHALPSAFLIWKLSTRINKQIWNSNQNELILISNETR